MEETGNQQIVHCTDGTQFEADIILVGAGVRVNTALAASAGVTIENGIKVDATARTSTRIFMPLATVPTTSTPTTDDTFDSNRFKMR